MADMPMTPTPVGRVHQRRLREVWRSAGWPCQDMVEVELLAAGLLERVRDGAGRDTLRVTDAGIRVLAETLNRHRASRDAHEALVARVATEMQRAGRVVWRGLSLRAPLVDTVVGPDGANISATRWAMAMPDVFSIRHTTVEDSVAPVVHEVKVQRSDLLGDLKRPAKGEAYRALCSECWYVIKEGIGRAEEIPEVYGVMVAHPSAEASAPFGFASLEVLRPAPKRPFRLPFALWMALARSTPEPADDTMSQARLGEGAEGDL